jgi:flagellar hook-associated protein 1 FlgK
MGDMISSGVSGLLAFQTALDTISNNIANVNTTGYNTETANLVTGPTTQTGVGSIGNGVAVSDVTRSYNDFLALQTNTANSSYNQLNTVSTLAASIDDMFSDPTTGLSATLQSFSQSIQTLSDTPSQTSARQAVFNSAQSVISQFQGYQGNLAQLNAQVNTQVGAEASTISSLAQNIASLNQQIMTAEGANPQQPPNSLLDQRDNLINQLSQSVSVNTVTQSNGSVSVFIGSGQALVVGTTAATLVATPDQFESGQQDLSLQSGSRDVDVTSALTGGTLGGLLQFRDQMLIPAENTLGQAAVTLTNLVNTQNAAGLDQNGNVGAALLAVGGPTVSASSNNHGNASVSATVSSVGGLTTSNYYLKYSGSSWSLVDTASGVASPLTAGSGGTLTGAGMTFAVTGTAQAGDEFLVQPTSDAISGLRLLTTDPTKIAAAGPLVASSGATNAGTASVESATVPDTADWTRGNYTITFGSPTAYTVTDAGGATVTTGTYTPGTALTPFNGIDVTLSGAPAANDTFSVNDNANGTGDNTNALKLAAIMNQGILNNGATSLSSAVNSFVGTVGLQTSQAQNGATAQQSVLSSAQSAQSSVSGVNLDEQAADMVEYEQAYQAAAQTIKTADTLFNSLLAAVQS